MVFATGLKFLMIHCNQPGFLNEKNTLVLSHLHKAYKPKSIAYDGRRSCNLSYFKGPERRVFYIDVGVYQMKAEQ